MSERRFVMVTVPLSMFEYKRLVRLSKHTRHKTVPAALRMQAGLRAEPTGIHAEGAVFHDNEPDPAWDTT